MRIGLHESASSASSRNTSGLSLSLPTRPFHRGYRHFTGIGSHLRECLPHRLFGSAGLEIFRNRGQRPNDVFDLITCHVGWTPAGPRPGKGRPGTARARAEQCAAPRRKGCYRPELSLLQNQQEPLPFLKRRVAAWGRWSGDAPGIRPVQNCKPGFQETELNKCLARPNRATRLQVMASAATPSSNNYFIIDRANPALEFGTFIASLRLLSCAINAAIRQK